MSYKEISEVSRFIESFSESRFNGNFERAVRDTVISFLNDIHSDYGLVFEDFDYFFREDSPSFVANCVCNGYDESGWSSDGSFYCHASLFRYEDLKESGYPRVVSLTNHTVHYLLSLLADDSSLFDEYKKYLTDNGYIESDEEE